MVDLVALLLLMIFLMVLGSHSSVHHAPGDHGSGDHAPGDHAPGSQSSGHHTPGDHGSGSQEFLQCQLAGHLLFFCHQLTENITEAASLGVLTTGTCTCRRFEF